jgi:8-amino-7-oxononanoate synthase
MPSLDNIFIDKLSHRKEEGLFRELKTNTDLIDFCSNDYLGLARSQALSELIDQNLHAMPVKNGATGSRLLSGNSSYAEELEQKLAVLFKNESSLIFNSGYTANIAVLSSIPQKGDTIIYDELAHASIRDGARLSHAARYSFLHNDLNDLEKKLKRSSGKLYIVVESIYSMDGDVCPLNELCQLANKYDACVILDEAHSTGSYGDNGSGLATSLSLEKNIDVRIYTFGKAMGIHGACVAGSNNLKQYLINFARPFIYTTALPQHSLVAIDSAFKFLSGNISLQNKLAENVKLFLNNIESGVQRIESESAIQTAIFSGNDRVKKIAVLLQNKGYDVRPILSPTVPKGKERLRICLHTYNTNDEIVSLANELNTISKSTE